MQFIQSKYHSVYHILHHMATTQPKYEISTVIITMAPSNVFSSLSTTTIIVLDKSFFWEDNGQRCDKKNFVVLAGPYYNFNRNAYLAQQLSYVESFNHVEDNELQRRHGRVTGKYK